MKQVIEYFGNTIVAVLAAGCVLVLFSGMAKNLREIAEVSLDFSQPGVAENQAFLTIRPRWKRRIWNEKCSAYHFRCAN